MVGGGVVVGDIIPGFPGCRLNVQQIRCTKTCGQCKVTGLALRLCNKAPVYGARQSRRADQEKKRGNRVKS